MTRTVLVSITIGLMFTERLPAHLEEHVFFFGGL